MKILKGQGDEELTLFKQYYETTKEHPKEIRTPAPLKTISNTYATLITLHYLISTNPNLLQFILENTKDNKSKEFLESLNPEEYLESNELADEDYENVPAIHMNIHPLLEFYLRDYSPVQILTSVFFSKLIGEYKETINVHHMINSKGVCIPSTLIDFKATTGEVFNRYVMSPKINNKSNSKNGVSLSIKKLLSTGKLNRKEMGNLIFNRPIFFGLPPFLIIDLSDAYKRISMKQCWKMNKLIIQDSLIIKSILEEEKRYSLTGIVIRQYKGVLCTPHYLPIIKENGQWNLNIFKKYKKFFKDEYETTALNLKSFFGFPMEGNEVVEIQVKDNSHFTVEAVFYTRDEDDSKQ